MRGRGFSIDPDPKGTNVRSAPRANAPVIGRLAPRTRITSVGPFGKNRDEPYLAMNPDGLVPTIEEEDGFTLGVELDRALPRRQAQEQPRAGRSAARGAQAQKWMDWQLTVMAPAIGPLFMGMVRTPPAERNAKAIDDSKAKTGDAARMLDEQLAQDPVPRRRRLLLRRHPGRHHGRGASASSAPSMVGMAFERMLERW